MSANPATPVNVNPGTDWSAQPAPWNRIGPQFRLELTNNGDYRELRAKARPAACTGGERCWVELGRDGYDTRLGHHNGGCIECKVRLS